MDGRPRRRRSTVDREEITVVLTLTAPETAEGATDAEKAEGIAGLVARFRAETRDAADRRRPRGRAPLPPQGGVGRAGRRHSRELFTHLAVPVMTRLRQPERQVLDTLVDAGVARSRAHALAWCVRLVGQNTAQWLGDLRSAMERVEQVRAAARRRSRRSVGRSRFSSARR